MAVAEPLRVIALLAEVFQSLGIRYFVGGSVASSLHGLPRSTLDVDIVATLDTNHVGPFVKAVEESFYVSAPAIREAISLSDSFNLIHLETMIKVDVFVMKDDPLWVEELSRAQDVDVGEGVQLVVASAEDIVLQKLLWYRLGGGTSDRQLEDVVGVLKNRGDSLDRDYLETWAAKKGIGTLLARVLEDAGL